MNSQECFLQVGLAFDWRVTREDDGVILSTYFRQSIPCLSPLFFPGNLVATITNGIYLFMFASPSGKGHVLFVSAFIVSSSVTWQEQEPNEYLLNWIKKLYNGGTEQSQLTWAQSFYPGLLSSAPHHWRPAVQRDSWPLSIWAAPWWPLGNSACRPSVGGAGQGGDCLYQLHSPGSRTTSQSL